MKRFNSVLIIAFLSLCALSVKAQNKIGARAGFQSSMLSRDGSEVAGTDPYNSFYVGLFKEKKIISLLSFGIGLEYMQVGATSSAGNNKLVLNYLDIPLYLKVKLGPVFAVGGTGINFKVGEKEYTNGISSTPNPKSSSVDVPAFLGVGVKIFFISVEARYAWGLIDINDGIHNQYFQVGAAVSF